jgi:hypothetical protein
MTTISSPMLSTASLERIVRLNNEGTAMLASSNERLSRQAMNLFREALSCIDATVSSFSSPLAAPSFAVEDVCQFCTVLIPAEGTTEDAVFYFHRQGIYLQGPALQQLVSSAACVSQTLRLFLTVVLMNTSLACCKVGCYFALQQTQQSRKKAVALHRRSLHLYTEVTNIYVDALGCRHLALFAMIAKNNIAWICLSFGHKAHAKHAHQDLLRIYEVHGNALNTPQAQDMAGEFYLNTAIMSMTDYLSKLPAGAA